MEKCVRIVLTAIVLLCPAFAFCQTGVAGGLSGLQAVLETIHQTMLAKDGELIDVGRGIAGFAATWYIAVRVWGHIARAEQVDLYPLFRPFVFLFCIVKFTLIIKLLDGVLQPTVDATHALVTDSNKAIADLLQQKEKVLETTNDWQMYVGPSGSGSEEAWEALSGDADFGMFSGVTNWAKFEMEKLAYNIKNSIKVWMSEILEVFYEAAALCINTVRVFYLIILAILGPIVFGLSVFDGMGHLLRAWLARYINVFLWLAVANIFGSLIGQIQEEMIKIDIAQLKATGQTSFGSTDLAYLIFLVMGIVGYFTVPSVTNHIIHAGGDLPLIRTTQKIAMTTVMSTTNLATNVVSKGGPMIYKASDNFVQGMTGNEAATGVTGAMGKTIYQGSSYLAKKLTGGDE